MIDLGKMVRDRVSGFEGIVIARTQWLNGCVRITVQGPVDKEGKFTEPQTIDEPQLEVLGDGVEVPEAAATSRQSGGPIPAPQRAKDPRR